MCWFSFLIITNQEEYKFLSVVSITILLLQEIDKTVNILT